MNFKTCIIPAIMLFCIFFFKSDFALGQFYKKAQIKSVILKNKKDGELFKKKSNINITIKTPIIEITTKKSNKKISKRILKGCLGAISGAILGLWIATETTPGGLNGIGYGIYMTLGFASAGCILGFFVF